MIEGSDGKYCFQIGLICIPGTYVALLLRRWECHRCRTATLFGDPGFWRMRGNIGIPLDEIHISGGVPQFKQKLQMSMNRFFKRSPVDKPAVWKTTPFRLSRRRRKRRTSIRTSSVIPSPITIRKTCLPMVGVTALHQSRTSPKTLRLRTERPTLR
ncbi:hypothetical protein F5J12DRAFT_863369 [Pisolithus orientalis]|uniref:uncharacterized protein n=1 Tax=Pisolithus orientalis TaxID=936130 RepID=UPI00222528E9|nr:uncharacterized protein F5J12DRAFT_863369 [Pisolithus orientalis]KAI5990030.1 hypothetical protein F5J12DRAFT_863369 [Pisolithus orientalis]